MGQPDFLVVGAKKSATTWLHDCLDHHPQVVVPAMKEVHFFCPEQCPKSRSDKGVQWYETQFPDRDGIVRGESSVDYMYYHDTTARAIASRYPSTKILFLLRNPVDRAYSDYWMSRRNDPEIAEFEDLIDLDHPFIARGLYHRQIQGFLEFFPKEQVSIFFHDDLVTDPAGFIRSVYGFLEVDADFEPPAVGETIAATRVVSSPLGRVLYRRMGNLMKVRLFVALWRWLKEHTPLKRLLFGEEGNKRGYPEMAPDVRRRLVSLYRDENKRLFDLVGREIPAWGQ